jgi:hypothetical protein
MDGETLTTPLVAVMVDMTLVHVGFVKSPCGLKLIHNIWNTTPTQRDRVIRDGGGQ